MKMGMKIGLSGYLLSAMFSFALVACGGTEGDESAPEELEAATTESALGGGGGHTMDDGWTYRSWTCAAGVPGEGPLFYATSCELSQAMDYAIATCERRSSGDCFQQGCTLEYSDRRCYR